MSETVKRRLWLIAAKVAYPLHAIGWPYRYAMGRYDEMLWAETRRQLEYARG